MYKCKCKIILLVVALATTTIAAVPGNPAVSIFTAVAPKEIFPNSMYKVSISVQEGSAPHEITASIKSLEKLISTQEIQIPAGTSYVISFEVGDLQEEKYNLTIITKSAGENFEDSTLIFVDRKERSLLLQTDKPIYKPGETVKFRVIVLDRYFKPLAADQTVELKVLDPQRNIIKIWKDVKVVKGLYSSELEISTEPNLGDWTIEVKSGDQAADSLLFSVDLYVLPKFKVDVNPPAFVSFNSSNIRAEIKATYTYGKGLKGDCTVTLKRKGYYYQPYGQQKKVLSKTLPIDGSIFVEFDTIKEDFGIKDANSIYSEIEFEIEASVKDGITGREQNGTASVKLYKYPYKIEQINAADSYQPGLPLTIQFKISSQDNVPIEDSAPDALTVTHGFSYKIEDSFVKSSLPSNGSVSFTFVTPSNEMLYISSVEATYKDLKQQFYLPQKSRSDSKIYVQLSLTTVKPVVNEDMEFILLATKPFESFSYVIYGRGLILSSGIISLPTAAKKHNFKLSAPAGAAPEGKIVVYTAFKPTNEIIADSVKFSIGSTLQNKFDIKLSAEILEPGQNVTISMKTKSNSLIALRGVDQSVLLLKEDKDINLAAIDNELVQLEQTRTNRFRLWGGSGAFQVFEQTGLVIITNGVLEKDRWNPTPFIQPMALEFDGDALAFDGMPGPPSPAMPQNALRNTASEMGFAGRGSSHEVRVRSNFPETWLWEEAWTEGDSLNISKTVPDTLTSWIITGYSLNSDLGIGVSLQPQVLKTFRPYFISLNLPYSVVKGEILSLQILVHNYMGQEINASVTLSNDDLNFEFGEENSKQDNSMTKSVVVGHSQVSSVTFVIVPTKFGSIMLKAKGITSNAGDAVSQALTVKPPGQKIVKTRSALIDLRTGTSKNYNLTTDFPELRVEGADSVRMTIIADLLGTTISNLDNLLQMPCGCGEQNMLNFVPDIVILDYLTTTGLLTPIIKNKAVKYLESGYQRELTYRHGDGSFSAFGKSDSRGSTWLTAFVVRSFVAAQPYITIDNFVILKALEFLSWQQQDNGSFQELGRVLHSDMQGGSSTPGLALTAYTLLAFIEAGPIYRNASNEISSQYDKQIIRGLDYIAESSDKSDIYAMNLIAYTLQVVNHTKKDEFFNLLKEKATIVGDQTHWEQPKKPEDKEDKEVPNQTLLWQTRKPETKPVSVEMTSYALLNYIHRNILEESIPVGKWLLKQRNAEGGFLSTQDTVVGLSALAKFAGLTRSPNTNIAITAEYSQGSKSVQVNEGNAMVVQEFFLPSETRYVDFGAAGKGMALAQLTWTYYVEDQSTKPAFTINVVAANVGSKLKVNLCASYVAGKLSNMAVVEVRLPSGYVFDSEDLDQLRKIPLMKRYDLDEADTKLVAYFDSFNPRKTCFKVSALRVFNIRKQAPAYVLVYDYYDTTKTARAFYQAPELPEQECRICTNDADCDVSNCVA